MKFGDSLLPLQYLQRSLVTCNRTVATPAIYIDPVSRMVQNLHCLVCVNRTWHNAETGQYLYYEVSCSRNTIASLFPLPSRCGRSS